ncbi:MAG TPA: DUF420 domain-containing protein [Polyangiaceae bacterium]
MILPAVNAVLNSTAALLLLLGYRFIRQARAPGIDPAARAQAINSHKRCMLSALGVSAVFLVCYLVHHAQVGSVPFKGSGFLRALYFAILVPHVLLAAAVVPLALVTISRGLKGQVERHKSLARVTLPVWLFVSASGVVVYLMLYQM